MIKDNKLSIARLCIAILLFFAADQANAYEVEHSLNAYFLVESLDEESGAKIPQMWDIVMEEGLDDNRQQYIKFRLIIFRISHVTEDTYVLRDIEVFESGPATQISFADHTLNAEFGTIKKHYVTLNFNDDGSLKNMSGIRVFTPDPEAKITYHLVDDPQQIHLIMPNNWSSGVYAFHHRNIKQ